MSEPLLSFCIATMNRAGFLRETLDCLVAQLTDDMEIVLLDGGSSDATESIMRDYSARFPAIRYLRHSVAHGVDRDYDSAVQAAGGRYCWLMTDDDLLKPGAVKAVREALQSDPSLVVVNAEVRDVSMQRVYEPSRLRIDHDQTFAPHAMSELFETAGELLTFIGAVVIRRDLWLARQRDPYFGSLFIHVGIIFQAPLPSTTQLLSTPWISIRYGNAMWRPREFEIWMFKWPSLVWSLPTLRDDARSAVTPSEPWRDPLQLLFYRAKGTYWLTDYRRLLQTRMPCGVRRFASWCAAVLPGSLANALALAWFRLLHPSHGAVISDLRSSCFHYHNWKAAKGMRR